MHSQLFAKFKKYVLVVLYVYIGVLVAGGQAIPSKEHCLSCEASPIRKPKIRGATCANKGDCGAQVQRPIEHFLVLCFLQLVLPRHAPAVSEEAGGSF